MDGPTAQRHENDVLQRRGVTASGRKAVAAGHQAASEVHAGTVGLVAKAAATGDRGLTDSPHH